MTTEPVSKNHGDYVRPIPVTWWLGRPTYVWFMIRELTCIFVGGYALFLLVLVHRAGSEDPEALATFVRGLKHPASVAMHLVAMVMALIHSFTWFNLTPKALVVWHGEERVSPVLIAGSNYVAWIVLSLLIAWFALR